MSLQDYQVVNASASPEDQINENNESVNYAFVYGKRQPVTSGLTWGYWGGRWGGFAVAAGTLTLTNSATNYVVVAKATGVISVSTSNTNWNNATDYARVYKLTVSGGVVTAEEDHRAGSGGVHGGSTSTVADTMTFKGVINCSANPNYPAADAGDVYKVSVAGKIGGGSGPNVEAGDTLYCITDSTASGTHAGVGANWVIVQVNVDGAVVGPASAVADNIVTFDGTSGKLVKDSGVRVQTTGQVSLVDGATIALDISLGATFDVTIAGDRTINFSGGAAALDGKKITIRIKQDGTGSRLITWGTGSNFGTDFTSITLTTTAGATDIVGVIYNHTAGTYDIVAYARGF